MTREREIAADIANRYGGYLCGMTQAAAAEIEEKLLTYRREVVKRKGKSHV